ncbi:hypothetical protein PVK06_010436 [Gossypium arboreum]|uniref:Chalcone-flavonone isomerase family protein n=6 Tax=Gossypium TaxID=3633 RepID=A0ABR0Q5Z2_GOSAR|nr:hypothetical protein PVK06_010436 [Gossypium arboreum]
MWGARVPSLPGFNEFMVLYIVLQERMDSVLINASVMHYFPEMNVVNLPRLYSDHNPILFVTYAGCVPPKDKRPFLSEANRLTDAVLSSIYESRSSDNSTSLVLAIEGFLAGRNTSNDICVNQEALHSMMKMQDRQGAMLLKIELLPLWNGQVSRNAPTLTHLLFVDDPMLFAHVSIGQLDYVRACLKEVGDASWLVANLDKSKLFVSPNIHRSVAVMLSSRCGIPFTEDLVLSSTSSIPLYSMQTTLLPASVCDELGFMFLISWRGYWQELIETLTWAHERTSLANLIRWRDKPVAVSIVQARLGEFGWEVGVFTLLFASRYNVATASPLFNFSFHLQTEPSLPFHCFLACLKPPSSIAMTTEMVMVDEVPFPPQITTTKPLSLLGHGITDIEIHFLQIKFTAIGVYLEPEVVGHLQQWKGKPGNVLAEDDDFFEALINAPVEKFLRVVVIKEIKGSQYGVQLESAVRDRLAADDKYEEEEEEALEKVVEFFQSKYFKKDSVITYHFPANSATAEIAFTTEGKEEAKIKVENANVVEMIKKWYLGGTRGVSATTISSLANTLSAELCK